MCAFLLTFDLRTITLSSDAQIHRPKRLHDHREPRGRSSPDPGAAYRRSEGRKNVPVQELGRPDPIRVAVHVRNEQRAVAWDDC